MKNVLKVIISILIVCATGAIVVFSLLHFGVIDFDRTEKAGVFEHTMEDGKIWTENNWQWVPAKVTETPFYDEGCVGDTGVFYLHLNNNDYYKIEIPTKYECYWDYGKCIYAKNGEFSINIVNGVDKSNIGELAGIDNPSPITSNLITNNFSGKSYRVLTSLIGETGYGIICNIYSGNDVFTCLEDCLKNDLDNLIGASYEGSTIKLDTLPDYDGKYASRNVNPELSLKTEKFAFATGDLYLRSDVRPINTIVNEYITLVSIMSQSDSISVFDKDGFYYIESGECYAGLYPYNSNTTQVLVGTGEEAKCNILSTLEELY